MLWIEGDLNQVVNDLLYCLKWPLSQDELWGHVLASLHTATIPSGSRKAFYTNGLSKLAMYIMTWIFIFLFFSFYYVLFNQCLILFLKSKYSRFQIVYKIVVCYIYIAKDEHMGQYLPFFKYQHKLFCLVDKSRNLDFYFDSTENRIFSF